MPDYSTPLLLVFTSCANPSEASNLGRRLVEERLVACASLIPGVQSIYRWQGGIETSAETLLMLKTDAAQIAALEARLHELHSYQTPEFLALEVDQVGHPYLDWLQYSLRTP